MTDRNVQAFLRSFQKVSALQFFLDLYFTALVAWSSLWLLSVRPLDFWSAPLFLLVYFSFYRGNAFIHEVVHFRKKLKGLGLSYNLLFGFPNRIPYYMHEPHKFHHYPATFGTVHDPEYLYLKGKGVIYFFRPFVAAPLSPFVLLFRFGLLPLFMWALPLQKRKTIFHRFSSLVVNPGYYRPLEKEEDLKQGFYQDLGCVLFLLFFIGGWFMEWIPSSFFVWWYFMAITTTAVNMFRARVAHLYDNDSLNTLKPLEALRDSVTVEGSWVSAFWAPLGLRFHAIHHLAPHIPYHNLGKAHRALKQQLENTHPYIQTVVPSLKSGLNQYLRTLKGNIE